MTNKHTAITYPQAIEEYYGGVHNLNSMRLPFKCRCGGTTYQELDPNTEITIEKPVMQVIDCYKHIRKVHKEKIKKTLEAEEGESDE